MILSLSWPLLQINSVLSFNLTVLNKKWKVRKVAIRSKRNVKLTEITTISFSYGKQNRPYKMQIYHYVFLIGYWLFY